MNLRKYHKIFASAESLQPRTFLNLKTCLKAINNLQKKINQQNYELTDSVSNGKYYIEVH